MAGLTAEDVPVPVAGCRHTARTAVIDAVEAFWTTVPTTPERTITRIAALRNRIATAAGVSAGAVSNKMVARAVLAYIDERFGGTD